MKDAGYFIKAMVKATVVLSKLNACLSKTHLRHSLQGTQADTKLLVPKMFLTLSIYRTPIFFGSSQFTGVLMNPRHVII